MEENGCAKSDAALELGVSRQHLYDILNEKKPVSAEIAVRLGKFFGNGPELWLRMQTACDLWDAQLKVDVSAIRTMKKPDPAMIAGAEIAASKAGRKAGTAATAPASKPSRARKARVA